MNGHPRRSAAGHTFLDVLFTATVAMVVTGVAMPLWSASVDRARATAAARHVAMQLERVRIEALKRSVNVGVRFVEDSGRYVLRYYVDGDGNGVRATDIARGVDVRLAPDDRLDEHFSGVQFGIHDDVIDPDSAAVLTGDPIRLGRTDILSFNPLGSSTSGTVYIAGRGPQQLAVRVLGATGRTRVLRYRFETHKWSDP